MRKRVTDTASQGSEKSDGDRQFVTSLHRGLEILRAFRPADKAGLGNSELAERTGLPNSTVSRLTFTLLKSGYLVYDEGTGRYRMGVPVLSLGYAFEQLTQARRAPEGPPPADAAGWPASSRPRRSPPAPAARR